MSLIECVPNFSEGRDEATLAALEAAILSVSGILLLGREADPDHNRSVFTFVGEPAAVVEAAVRAVGVAAERINLTQHQGVHPRIGAADVVPFVPVEDLTLADCIPIAHRAGEEIWRRFGVAVYFYEAAALAPDRERLENIRLGKITGGPDLGSPHPTAGATVVGARQFLIAYNINLATPDLGIAQDIARQIRTSSGGLPHVKALGLPLASRNQAQVSMNLTNFEVTPPHVVFQAVEAAARARGVAIASSELIGFVPRRALEMAFNDLLRFENFHAARVLENALAAKLKESAR
ncbi:MAG: glutamate formimidoyltransferase [Bryobacter sp.]|nr:glutamate formimidoyltransferase [Bryobacter sp.]